MSHGVFTAAAIFLADAGVRAPNCSGFALSKLRGGALVVP
jgi:hypothetical protein